MSDRTSARLFGRIFRMLEEDDGPLDRKEMARRLWGLSQRYDFCPSEMHCDEELVALGLARLGVDFPNEGEVMQYGLEEPST